MNLRHVRLLLHRDASLSMYPRRGGHTCQVRAEFQETLQLSRRNSPSERKYIQPRLGGEAVLFSGELHYSETALCFQLAKISR
jgi:hypothetical protein